MTTNRIRAVAGAIALVALAAAPAAQAAGWEQGPTLPTTRSSHATVSSQGAVYAIGGFAPDYSTESPTVVALLLGGSRDWMSVPSLNAARIDLAGAAAPDGTIYAVGGDGDEVGSTVEVYRPGAAGWDLGSVPPLPVPVRAPAATVGSDGSLYVLGGVQGSDNTLRQAIVYSGGRSWRSLPDLPDPRGGAAAVTGADGRIYLLGGDPCAFCGNGSTEVDVYDPGNPARGWRRVQDMNVPRTEFAAAVASDGRIWVAGGDPFRLDEASSEVYDPSTNAWTMTGDVTSGDNPSRDYVSGAIGGDGLLYVVGGDECGGDGCPVDSVWTRDVTPPSAPTGVQVTVTSPTTASLTWSPSSDNVRVDHYDLYRNGTRSQSAKTTSTTVRGLAPCSTTAFAVRAIDADANASALSVAANLVLDTTPPPAPAAPTASVAPDGSVNLSWSAVADGCGGPVSYRVSRNGAVIGQASGPSFHDPSTVHGQTYAYTLTALDGAGNASPPSASASVTVPIAVASVPTAPTAPTAPPPATTHRLDVHLSGTGSGTVASAPAGISCGVTCSASYVDGTVVLLTATPAAGSTFSGWGGVCPVAPTCTVTISADTTVTAGFGQTVHTDTSAGPPPSYPPPARSLEVSVSGGGSVTTEPVGGASPLAATIGQAARATTQIRCGLSGFRCYTTARPGTTVKLRARPAPGQVFRGWGGACAAARTRLTCVTAIGQKGAVYATFASPHGAISASLERPAFHVLWARSIGRGTLVVAGRVNRTAHLRLELRRPFGGPLLVEELSVSRGRFVHPIRLSPGLLAGGARLFPGGFIVSMTGRTERGLLPPELQTVVLDPPASGVARRAYATARSSGSAATTIRSASRQAYAHFDLQTQPRRGARLSVSWYWPNGKLLGTVVKNNNPRIVSVLGSSVALPPGAWRAVLRAGSTIVSTLSVRVR